MATLAVSNVFAANTLAEASEVNQNFDDVEAFINTNMIQKDSFPRNSDIRRPVIFGNQ